MTLPLLVAYQQRLLIAAVLGSVPNTTPNTRPAHISKESPVNDYIAMLFGRYAAQPSRSA
jgi:hypothetical protein